MRFFSCLRHVRRCGLVAEFVGEFIAGLGVGPGVVVCVKDVDFVGSGGG